MQYRGNSTEVSIEGCSFLEPWLDETLPWEARVERYRECLQSQLVARMDIHEKSTPYVELASAENALEQLLEDRHMSDGVNIRLMNEQIQENARQLSRHEERFAYMQGRFDSIDASHAKLRESVEEIKRKIFNGYESTIKNTRDEVAKVHNLVQDLYRDYAQHSSRPHMDSETVKEIVKSSIQEYRLENPHIDRISVKEIVSASISEYDSKALRERDAGVKWWKHHKLEVFGAIGVLATIISTTFAVLAILGVL